MKIRTKEETKMGELSNIPISHRNGKPAIPNRNIQYYLRAKIPFKYKHVNIYRANNSEQDYDKVLSFP